MALSFVFGASGAGKSYQTYSNIIEQSMKEPQLNYLVVVPDQFTMQTQKELVTMHPNKGIMNIDVLSFGRLAHRVFGETGGNDMPVLDDTGKSLVLRLIAEREADKLSVMGGNLKKIGYIHEVKSVISEFMQYDISPNTLQAMISYAEKRGTLQYKLKDLSILYSSFLEFIKTQYITTEESLDILRNQLHKSKLIKTSVILFDGFTGFTPVQNKLLQELMVRAKDVIVTVTIDGRENPFAMDGEQKLFHLSKKTINTLEELASQAGVPRGRDIKIEENPVRRFENNKCLAHLERGLFRYSKEIYQENPEAITVSEVGTPMEEVRQAFIKMKELVRNEGYAYRDMVMVVGSMNIYAPYVETECEKYEIPVYLDQTRKIVLNPFIEAMKSILQIIQNNFSYESVFHYFRSGFSDFSREEIDRLENYILAMGVRGKKNWRQVFVRRSKKTPESDECMELFNHMREKLYADTKVFLEKECTAVAYTTAFYQFLTAERMQEKVSDYRKKFKDAGDLVKEKEYSQIYQAVMKLLDQIVALLGEERLTFTEFCEIMEAGFDEITVGVIPQSVDKVVVGDLERTRLGQVKVLFLIGVNDGNIPKSSVKGGLISDIEREYLNQRSEWELAPTPRQQMYIQKLYLYLTMTKPTDKLYLSYAATDGEGKAVRPSYLIETIRRLYPKMSVEKPESRSRMDMIQTGKDGVNHLVKMLRNYADGNLHSPEETEFFTLYHYYKQEPSYGKLIDILLNAAFSEYRGNRLNKEVAEALYGTVLVNSVSRLEQYAKCAYSQFLQYGLKLRDREQHELKVKDVGTIFHGVLEEFGVKLEEKGISWLDFDKETGEQIVAESLDNLVGGYQDAILYSSARNEYAITRMKRILNRSVSTLQYQLKKGLFKPEQLEVSFDSIENLDSVNIALSAEEKMRLVGRIDRVDIHEDTDKIFVKVLDYKSGKKDFDLVALYYGLQLQLVVYMNAAMEMEKRKHANKEIVPSAMLYYHISDPMIECDGDMTPEEISACITAELKTTGMINADGDSVHLLDTSDATKSDVIPVAHKKDGSFTSSSQVLSKENFQTISNYVNYKIKSIGSSIVQGDIDIHPYTDGRISACTYCSYHSICEFDSKIPGYEKWKAEGMTNEEILQKME